jgi:hypothetical protein
VLPPFPDVVALIVATVVYGGLVVTTRAVPDEVREALLPRLRRG